MWHVADELEMEEASKFDNPNLANIELENMRFLREVLRAHSLPAVALGASNFKHKFRALVHAVRLEEFSDVKLANWSKSVISCTSDYGVEHLLGKVQPIDAHEVRTWVHGPSTSHQTLRSRRLRVKLMSPVVV